MIRPFILAALLAASPAYSHDIYSNLHVKGGGLPCCGGESAGAYRDCWRTIYRERGSRYQFQTKAGDWVEIPEDQIQFTPIPGDKIDGDSHMAHLCYRDEPSVIANYHEHGVSDRLLRTESGKELVFYCAIIPPGGT